MCLIFIQIMEYDIKAQGYTIWSRQLNNSWHQQWLKRTSKITNLYYQPGKEHLLHVIDEQMLCIIDQTQVGDCCKIRILEHSNQL